MNSPYSSTILLVEDDPADVFRIQRAFRKTSLASSLEVVTDGEKAIYSKRQKAEGRGQKVS